MNINFDDIKKGLKKAVKTPVSYHAAGPKGKLSRILNPALGGQVAFCVDRFSESSTMEQLHLETAKKVINGLEKLL
jgi:3-dehydroquinate dehydratase